MKDIRFYQALEKLRMTGHEVGKTARGDGTPRIAIDGILKTCEQIMRMADKLRKPVTSVSAPPARRKLR